MKTIEERAKEAGIISQYKSDYRYDKRSVESGYLQGAKEQKEIDKNDKEEGEALLYTANKVAERTKKEMIDKACAWFEKYLAEIGYPDDWCRDSDVQESGEKRFRKFMEE